MAAFGHARRHHEGGRLQTDGTLGLVFLLGTANGYLGLSVDHLDNIFPFNNGTWIREILVISILLFDSVSIA